MKISTRITGAFLITVAGVMALSWSSHVNLGKINDARGWVEHTLEVLIAKERLESSLKDLESRTRGYAMSGDERFLEGTLELNNRINRNLDKLKLLTADNQLQQSRLEQLSPLLSSRLEQIDQLRQGRKDGGLGVALQRLKLPESGANWNWSLKMDEVKTEEERLLRERTVQTLASIAETETTALIFTVAILSVVAGFGLYIIINLKRSVGGLVDGTENVARGELNHRIPIVGKDELTILARAFNLMTDRLRTLSDAQKDTDWKKTSLNEAAAALQSERNRNSIGRILLEKITSAIAADQAALYAASLDESSSEFELIAVHAAIQSDELPKKVTPGEGLIGQCALSFRKTILHGVEADSFLIKTALTSSTPFEVVIMPLIYQGEVLGILEIACSKEITPICHEFLDEICIWAGGILSNAKASDQVDKLLADTQQLNEELQAQQEELETQQDDLRVSNEELEEKADMLDLQNKEILDKNLELEEMQLALEDRANELSMASRYKSDFLANMSHDLRTPLNSLLIFSELLAENDDKNLQEYQVDYAKNIHAAGKSLLSLIDDILDLSKIESGTVVLDAVDIPLENILDEMKRNFEKTAESKKLEFAIAVDKSVPNSLKTDYKRLSQLLTNLLTNAFKFTDAGSVKLQISRKTVDLASRGNGSAQKEFLSFVVSDTGIGIPEDKQRIVFEAFRQADRSIKQKYGGTGLGLAICRQLSELLGGFIDLKSAPGVGSVFTVVLPVEYDGKAERHWQIDPSTQSRSIEAVSKAAANLEKARDDKIMQTTIEDDRLSIDEEDRVVLSIEDDPAFARMLLDMARKQSFKSVVALTANEGLILARTLKPDGITLDLKLPDMDGWVVLDQLKADPSTRHIPVHIISVEPERQRSLELGAVGYLEKPVTVNSLSNALNTIKELIARDSGRLLIVEHDQVLRQQLTELLSDPEIQVTAVATGKDALSEVERERPDCVIIDINLDDIDGIALIEQIQNKSGTTKPPILFYSDRPFSKSESDEFERLRRSSMVKDVHSPERLLDEALLFLHRVEAGLPESKRKMLALARQMEMPLAGRKVLLVDDDPRNIAALVGILKKQGMDMVIADNGKKAIQQLGENPGIELILMDMMMPEMDGYEAMKAIRRQSEYIHLPIIAVTAKAMKEDRRKCLESGASDYIAKPVDKSQLLSLLRVWLYRK